MKDKRIRIIKRCQIGGSLILPVTIAVIKFYPDEGSSIGYLYPAALFFLLCLLAVLFIAVRNQLSFLLIRYPLDHRIRSWKAVNNMLFGSLVLIIILILAFD